MNKFLLTALLALIQTTIVAQKYDLCVYGGTSAGVIAACTAARLHKKVILIEPGKHLGGLSSGGLGYTDIGNKYVVTGLARDFYRRVGKHYRKFEAWIFEPHVAEDIFNDYIKEAKVPVLFNYRITAAIKHETTIEYISLENTIAPNASSNKSISAKMFIDCSYEGDLMAKAGVSYIVGREDNNVYHEIWNGVQLMDKHQFPDNIDPYKTAGDTTSGLLWGINNSQLVANGTGNSMVQAYNYRLCLTNDASNKIDITQPVNYDSSKCELLLRLLQKRPSKTLDDGILNINMMPNHKTDINNNGPFSTDMIGMNYNYPDASYDERENFLQSLAQYTKGLLYFIGHDKRMPGHLRNEMLQWGYPKDEFKDNQNFTWQPYIREGRRMIGSYVMTQSNCEGKEVVTDGISMAAYTMDSHNCERLVINGMVKNEGDVQKGGFGPYPVSYRAITPKANECTNLLVPVCLSASHIAYGSIRMEPVFMVLAESAAAAACMAINNEQTVQQISIKQLQHLLLSNPLIDGSQPEILIDDNDSLHTTISGNWSLQHNGGYGATWLKSLDIKSPVEMTYTPQIPVTKNYTIYTYLPDIDSATKATNYIINNNGTIKHVLIAHSKKAEGQTSGEWIALGKFKLIKDANISVTITNKNADGFTTADAILFVPEN